MKIEDYTRRSWLHRLIYRIGRVLIQAYYLPYYRFRPERVKTGPGGTLILCSHAAGADPLFVSICFPRPLYFVASEHLIRRKIGRLALLLQSPIIRLKGKPEADAALEILRRLRAGHDVCLFVEGERSYDGCTAPIAASAAHLAQLSGRPLVLYRLHGAYFSHPRWSHNRRRGRMWGECAARFSAEQLQRLTREQAYAAILDGLAIDAYAEQEHEPVAYCGKGLAENLETALFLCPLCGEIGGLTSAGDRFSCGCGLDLAYDVYGYFRSQNGLAAPFATVRDWYRWQQGKMQEIAASGANSMHQPLLSDERQRFSRGLPGTALAPLGSGRLALYADRLELSVDQGQRLCFPLAELGDLACEEQMLLSFLSGGLLYEVRSPYPRAAVKYQLLFRALKQAAAEQGGI